MFLAEKTSSPATLERLGIGHGPHRWTLMVAVLLAEIPSAPWYVVWISVLTGIGGIVTTAVQWFRGRRTDTMGLYSSFVDDLHAELGRMKAIHDQDYAAWLSEKRQMQYEIDQLRFEIRQLRAQLGIGANALDVSPEAKSQIKEVMRQMGILTDPPKPPTKEG